MSMMHVSGYVIWIRNWVRHLKKRIMEAIVESMIGVDQKILGTMFGSVYLLKMWKFYNFTFSVLVDLIPHYYQ